MNLNTYYNAFATSLVEEINLSTYITKLIIDPTTKCKKKFNNIAFPYYLNAKLNKKQNGMIAQPYKKKINQENP